MTILTLCIENIKVSDTYQDLLSWLLESSSDERDAHSRLFSLLVLLILLPGLSGEQRVDASLRFLNAVGITSMDALGDDEGALDEESTLRGVVAKPNSRTTTQRLQLMIMTRIASMPCPQGPKLG